MVAMNDPQDQRLFEELLAAVRAEELSDIHAVVATGGIAILGHQDEQGRTVLHVGAMEGRLQSCEALIDLGAPVDHCDRQGRTPLHLASSAGQPSVCVLLFLRGAQIMARDGENRTPADLAIAEGRESVLLRLMACGITPPVVEAPSRDQRITLSLTRLKAAVHTNDVHLVELALDEVSHRDGLDELIEQTADYASRGRRPEIAAFLRSHAARRRADAALAALQAFQQLS